MKINPVLMAALREGLSAYELSKMTGVSGRAMYDIMYKNAVPRTATLNQICSFLNLDIIELYKYYHEDDDKFKDSADS